jgi:hypothetical protein
MSDYELTNVFKKDTLLNEANELLLKKKSNFYNNDYMLIQYNKEKIENVDYGSKGLFRSTIFNLDKKQMVCFSPPKSLTFEQFCNNKPNKVIVEEFVEGTMINLFFDKKWQIATKGSLGANTQFYQDEENITFSEMFNEICMEINFDFENLPKDYCYSFIIQHTKNRIIKSIEKNCLYFITCYEIKNEEDKITVRDLIDSETIENIILKMKETSYIKFPKVYDTFSDINVDNFERYKELYASKNTKYDIMGVVFKNSEDGSRAKLRNPVYQDILKLKGNHCKIQYIYLELRKLRSIDKYLRYYPNDSAIFSCFRNMVHEFTKNLYDNYVDCYIKKKMPLKDYPHEYKIHMFNLHKVYLNELIQENKYVTIHVVIQYFNDLHPSQQMYVLNYNLRKKNIDTFKAEIKENN